MIAFASDIKNLFRGTKVIGACLPELVNSIIVMGKPSYLIFSTMDALKIIEQCSVKVEEM